MSKLALKTVKLGDNADLSKNFLIKVPAVADGTLTIEREDGTDVLTIDASGNVAFPAMPGFGYAPIIESGSNANGSYIKFADGTMIQRGVYTVSLAISTNWLGGFISAVTLIPLPVAFSNTDYTSVSTGSVDNASFGVLTSAGSQTTTQLAVRFLSVTTQSSASRGVSWIATGRWK